MCAVRFSCYDELKSVFLRRFSEPITVEIKDRFLIANSIRRRQLELLELKDD